MQSTTTRTLWFCAALFMLILPTRGRAGEHAQKPDSPAPFPWTRERKLAIQDFWSKVPSSAVADARSFVGLDASWQCSNAKLTFDVRAVFDPTQSWARAASMDEVLLRHEQVHFDLTEVFARKLRQQFIQLQDRCEDPEGARPFLDRAVGDNYREWQEAHKKYDEETHNGTQQDKQRVWDQQIQRQLDQLEDFS